MRKRFFPGRVVGHRNRLPREVFMAPSLSEFKDDNWMLVQALSHVV